MFSYVKPVSLNTDIVEYHVKFTYAMTRKKYAKLVKDYDDAHDAYMFEDIARHIEHECGPDCDTVRCDRDQRGLPYVYLQMRRTNDEALKYVKAVVEDVNHERHRWNQTAVAKLQTLVRRACSNQAFLARAVMEGMSQSGRGHTELALSVLLPSSSSWSSDDEDI
jgi:hypothetical protein